MPKDLMQLLTTTLTLSVNEPIYDVQGLSIRPKMEKSSETPCFQWRVRRTKRPPFGGQSEER